MLCSLNIKDLAVVQTLDLEFDSGLTVLTGETGAGKSILLTALGLALGDRADSGFIRPGAAKAEITLEFSLNDAPDARDWLAEHELADDADSCLIRRVIGEDGRSRAFVNNRQSTLQSLQELASRLVEIHGQHAHLHLLRADEQRRLLDESAGNPGLLLHVGELYRQWRRLRDELESTRNAASDGAAREDMLRYQIEELEQHDIDHVDYDALSEEHTRQANVGKILGTGQMQLDLLYEDERHSVNALLVQAIHALGDMAQLAPEFGDCRDLLGEAQIQVKEAALQLRRQLDRTEADPSRLEWLDQKLGDLHRFARKHQVPPQQLKERLADMRDERAKLAHRGENLAELEARLQTLETDYRKAATELSAIRSAAASRLGDRITQMIRELGMPQGDFRVEAIADPDATPSPQGNDRIEFLVSTNPGLPPRPLSRVASGGELSRISLAIQVAATDSKTVPTLIFDEVDTGIGGGVAEIVGQKLRSLGRDHQVFCVTHLHQVAAQGHQHLLVEKLSDDDGTRTRVRKLAAAERTQEIARMLGGVRITEQTLAHAEELLNAAG